MVSPAAVSAGIGGLTSIISLVRSRKSRKQSEELLRQLQAFLAKSRSDFITEKDPSFQGRLGSLITDLEDTERTLALPLEDFARESAALEQQQGLREKDIADAFTRTAAQTGLVPSVAESRTQQPLVDQLTFRERSARA